jgi:hypothetical protein
MKKYIILFSLMLIIPCAVVLGASQPKIDLRGVWRFAIDNQDKGVIEQWFSKSLSETVTLPGSMATNGKGFDVTLSTKWTGQIVDSSYYYKPEYAKYRVPGNIKVPFWLQPLKYYVGAAWYQKEVNIPKDWEDKDIRLFLERCHWESRLWIDDKEIAKAEAKVEGHDTLVDIIRKYAHHYIAWFRDTPIVQEAIKKHSKKFDVLLPIGTSGSGKSTFIQSIDQHNLIIIEPDAMITYQFKMNSEIMLKYLIYLLIMKS